MAKKIASPTDPRNAGYAGIALLALLPALSMAQSVEAPPQVCAGDEFEVEWTGPDGTGDQITIADQSAAPDVFRSAQETAQGSPATLRAPFMAGEYDVRYVAAAPLQVLEKDEILVTECSGSQSSGESGPLDAVIVAGIQTDYGDAIAMPDGAAYSLEDLCSASGTIAYAMGAIIDQIESSMTSAGSPVTLGMIENLPGAPTRAGIADGLHAARDELCQERDQAPNVYPFVITYAQCRMAMATPAHAMEIHLPPGQGTGRMSMADHATREIATLTLRPSLEAASIATGTGWSNQVAMTSTGASGTRIGFPVRNFDFEYSGGLGGDGIPAIASMVSMKNEGTVWVSDAVPGIEIVRSFYENLTREMDIGQGAMSFFGGLVNNLVGLLREGLPLEIDQTVSSGIMGKTAVSGRSHAIATSVQKLQYHSGWCSQSLMPSDYAVTDIDQQISDVMSSSGVDSAEMQEAMQQYNDAMQQMTPEQKAMMENMGLGDMMNQMLGGAASGGQASAAAAAAGTAGAGAAGAATRGGSNMPSSAELRSDDLTVSVQRHLEALGYDVGNTDGELSMETTIAISTFQAEKGMDVTGEVSPQLLGVLAAEVDSRR